MASRSEKTLSRIFSHSSAWLGAAVALFLFGGAGCKPDICKGQITRDQRCGVCKPKDNELLARLNPTELPLAVRRAIERCAKEIHATDPRNFVTQEALIACVRADRTFDAGSQASIAKIIRESNLMTQDASDNWHLECLAMGGATPSSTTTPGSPSAAPAVPPTTGPTPGMAPSAPGPTGTGVNTVDPSPAPGNAPSRTPSSAPL